MPAMPVRQSHSPQPVPQKHSRADKIFAVAITVALVGALVGAIFKAFDFWHGMNADFDPAATWPLILGVLLSLGLGGIVVGIFLYGRRQEIRDGE